MRNESVKLGFLIGDLNGLIGCAADIGSSNLNGITREKVYIVAGPEFGPEWQGKRLIIDKSIYGLQSSGARFHELTTLHFRKMGFTPTKADPDLLMRKHKDGHYEYLTRFVDDVISFAKDPLLIMKELEKRFLMKGVGAPRYYLGGDVHELDDQCTAQDLTHALLQTLTSRTASPNWKK